MLALWLLAIPAFVGSLWALLVYRVPRLRNSKLAVAQRIDKVKSLYGPTAEDFRAVWHEYYSPVFENQELKFWKPTDVLKYNPKLKEALENLESKTEGRKV